MNRRIRWILTLTVTLLLLFSLSSCAQAPDSSEAPQEETTKPTDAPQKEEASVVDEPVETKPIIMATYLEAANLNSYYQTGPEAGNWIVVEGLVGISAEGTYVPQLITEVPSIENGMVSEDGKVITYTLIEGLKWSDGEPVTSADIRFTWEAIMNPASSVAGTKGHENIVSVETPDDLTAIVTLKEQSVEYQTLFPALLPEHVLGDLDSMDNADYNRKPIGTGPYVIVEWVPGSHIEYGKNPYYREEGKPLTDTLILRYLASREAGLVQFISGEIDVMFDVYATEVAMLEQDPDIEIVQLELMASSRLFMNLSDPTDETKPHPVLSDGAIRQAMSYAIDRQLLIDGTLDGLSTPGSCDLTRGAFATDPPIEPVPYDPDMANALLDDAGWVRGDDGIRVKDGVRASVRVTASSGSKQRELQEQIMQEELADVGIELIIANVPSSIFWGSYSDGGILFTGDFDMLLYYTGPAMVGSFLDPQGFMYKYYHSSGIPTEATNHSGGNYMRYANDIVDAALEEAGSTVDIEARRAAYAVAMRQINEDNPLLFLFNNILFIAYSKDVKGWEPNPWLPTTPNWDAQNWFKE